MRIMTSDYMHWAKTRAPVRYNLGSSEVPHFRLDGLGIDVAELELDGASRHRDPALRAAIARKCDVTPDMVVMTDGTSMANMLAFSTLLLPGDEVAAEAPAYEPMIAAARHVGAVVRPFARRAPDFAIDLDALAAAITPRTRLILLTNLHNPTGNLTGEDVLREIGELAARAGAYVLVDEVYLDAGLPRPRTAALLGERFVATGSLTKCYGLSGLRCGWILAAPELAERMWRLNELFGVAQPHAAECLSRIALERIDEVSDGVSELLARNRSRVNAFLAARDDLDCAPVTQGITCFPRLIGGDVDALNDRLRAEHDAAIVPGRFFGAPDRFRLGFGQPTDIVEGGLERLAAALDALR